MEELYEIQYEDTGFAITDDSTADWAVKKIAEEAEELERIERIAEAEIADIEAKLEGFRNRYESKTQFLKGKLMEYFDTVDHKETKTQESYSLLSGKLIKKKAKTKLIHDDEKLLVSLRDSGRTEFIKVKETVAWSELKKTLDTVDGTVVDKSTGEVMDGIVIEEVAAEFVVQLPKKEEE